ncbi:MAG: glycosyltransferase family 39 protein, partial [Deltaproteobacteria bacterium]|nr:glycosyltransferase family 39 protein [Deltaproteobacteria bacterium]
MKFSFFGEQKRLQPTRLSVVLKWSILICAIAYLLLYVAVAGRRISYPYDLEWMEGGSVDHVIRLLSGQRIYVEPSLEFIPFVYTPLFFYVGAVFSRLIGVGFLSLRLISFLASLGCLAILFEFVRRETGSVYYGLLSAGLFAATYRIGGAWFDIARVDSLFLLFLLLSVYLLRFCETTLGLLLSGVLMSLSILTKQPALIVSAAMAVYCVIYLPRWKKLVFPSVVLLALVASTLVLNRISSGWYIYYVFRLPFQHPV